MKIIFKIVAVLLIGVSVYLFWNTSHNNLKGDISSKLEHFVDEKAEEVQLNGTILVAKGNEILFQKGYGYANQEKQLLNDINTLFPIGSLTKSFTAVSILQLEEEGKLSTEQKLSDFVTDFPNGDNIKIHHLLTHSSGIPELLKVVDNTKEQTPIEMINQVKNEEIQSQPGEKYSYSNSNYLLLGYIIEQVSGKTYHEYVKENIFDKANMRNSDFLNGHSADYAIGYENMKQPSRFFDNSLTFATGDVVSTVGDMHLYNEAINNHILLSKEATDKMQTGYIKSAPLGIANYGYGWQVLNNKISLDKKMIQHAGGLAGHKAEFARFVDEEITVIILTNNQGKTNLGSIAREITSIILDKRFFKWQKFI